jgi:transcriptional regulator with XRE-family HTH domain
MTIGEKLRELREGKGLFLRQVAAALEVDSAYISKFESGEKMPLKKHIVLLSELFNVSESELITLWLSDKLMEIIKDEPAAADSLTLTLNRVRGAE